MNRMPLAHRAVALLVLAGGLTAALWLGSAGGTLYGEPVKPSNPPAGAVVSDITVGDCAGCHGGPVKSAGAYERYDTLDKKTNEKVTQFIRCDEYDKWNNYDPHQYAFTNLSTPVGKRMAELLKWENKDMAKHSECMACHAVETTPVTTPLANKTFSAETDQGVNCAGCHGSTLQGWTDAHKARSWRDQEPATKAKWGQHDLRDPQVRAARCAACHVGNKAEGKFVTHEMYAAGHPPLPPLEVARFGDFQTVHWYKPAQNVYFNQTLKGKPVDETYRLFHYRPDVGDMAQARLVVIGALTTFRETMATLADEAKICAESEKDPEKAQLLDLANFDCWACHHDLKRPSWRQERGYKGVAGRPVMRPVPHALVRVAQELYNPGAKKGELDEQMKALQKSFDLRAFGHPAQVRDAAGKARDWCDTQIAAIKAKPDGFTKEQSRQLLIAISNALGNGGAGMDKAYDFDEARQLLWAFEAVRAEYSGDTAPANVVSTKIDKLNERFHFPLRPKVNQDKPSKTPPEPLSGSLLQDRLTWNNTFEPADVRATFKDIFDALSKAKPVTTPTGSGGN